MAKGKELFNLEIEKSEKYKEKRSRNYTKDAGGPPRCKAYEKGKATKAPSPKVKVGPIRTKTTP